MLFTSRDVSLLLSFQCMKEWYLVHRGDLHNQLKNRALKTAILHTRCKITTIDINDSRPSVILDDGRKFDADVLLGADGLHVCAPIIISVQRWGIDKLCSLRSVVQSHLKRLVHIRLENHASDGFYLPRS
jgi:hypothetical protein